MVAGLGARFYAYDRIAVMPPDAKIDAVAATAPDAPATYFDIGKLKEVTGPLTNRTKVRGDVAEADNASSDTGKDAVVWQSYTCTGPTSENCLANRLPLAATLENTAFARHGSEVIDWDGNYRETGGKHDDKPQISGYVFKLPFNVGKRDYTWYNSDLGKPVKLTYKGESSVKGLRTYRFVEDVTRTKLGTIDLPGNLADSEAATVTGDIWYTARLEMDVEPESGVAMTTVSSPNKWVEVDGKKVLTMIKGTFSLTNQTVTDNVDTYKPLASGLKAIRIWVPIVGVAVGLLCFLAASLLLIRRRRVDISPGAARATTAVDEQSRVPV